MKLNILLLSWAILALASGVSAGAEASEVPDTSALRVVPLPNDVALSDGFFDAGHALRVSAPAEFDGAVGVIARQFEKSLPNFSVAKVAHGANVVVEKDATLSREEYRLNVGRGGISIAAASDVGVLYAFQTLRQAARVSGGSYKIPLCKIADKPAFSWRGCMIDSARHFLGKRFILDTIDRLLELKMNVLHLHLTDHQGWRLEIKKYPKLTEVGAWYHETARGGFLTQDDAREIVEYAKARGITVVPEIEVLSHATAAAKAYPFLGDGYGINVYDPKVREFFKDVLREVMDIFPSEVIHLAGDEVEYSVWRKNPEIKKYMEANGLKTLLDVHLFYMNEMGAFLRQNGRRMIAWDEAFGKGAFEVKKGLKAESAAASKDAIMHFWTGNIGAMVEAANDGYKVVNANRRNTYFNYPHSPSCRYRIIPIPEKPQLDDTDRRYYVYTSKNLLPLSKVYNFNPIPDGVGEAARKNIIGTSCQVWSKPIASVPFFEYMAFPRMAALAEVAWTNAENKNFDSFVKRLNSLQLIWDYEGVNHNYEAVPKTEFYPEI